MTTREDRAYRLSVLPTLRNDCPPQETRALLLSLYEQTCSTWRMLVDIRFKLYSLVPTVSLASFATVFGGADAASFISAELRLLFAILGLTATLGLLIYELRNSQLHDDLISRARKIEDELGVDTGVFRGRLSAKGILRHDNATRLIYGAAMASWIAAIWVSARAL